MKLVYVTSAVVATTLVSSCMSRNPDTAGEGSTTKAVTINQPDLKGQLIASLSEDEKKKVIESLVYELSISAAQKDGKDDCSTGVSASKVESGVSTMDKSTFDTIKVKKGCNYLVSMKIGAKSDDSKTIRTLYLSSWDDKQPAVLSKEELEKAKPNVAVKLYVTAEGKKFWDADIITAASESDVGVQPELSKTFKLKASGPIAMEYVQNSGFKGSITLKPVSASKKDMYCALALHSSIVPVQSPDAEPNKLPAGTNRNMYLYPNGKIESSIIKFDANVEAGILVSSFKGDFGDPKLNPGHYVPAVIAMCSDSEKEAVDLLKQCLGTPKGEELVGRVEAVCAKGALVESRP